MSCHEIHELDAPGGLLALDVEATRLVTTDRAGNWQAAARNPLPPRRISPDPGNAGLASNARRQRALNPQHLRKGEEDVIEGRGRDVG